MNSNIFIDQTNNYIIYNFFLKDFRQSAVKLFSFYDTTKRIKKEE